MTKEIIVAVIGGLIVAIATPLLVPSFMKYVQTVLKLPESILQEIEPPSSPGNYSVVANATYKYWEECLKLGKHHNNIMKKIEEKFDGPFEEIPRDQAARLFKQMADEIIKVEERVKALSIQNVDEEVIKLFIDGRNLGYQRVKLLDQIVIVLRNAPLSRKTQMELDELSVKLDDLDNEDEKYRQKWELLRVELVKRYNKNFSGNY